MLSFLLTLISSLQSEDKLSSSSKDVAQSLLNTVPWKDLCNFLNWLAQSEQKTTEYETVGFIYYEPGKKVLRDKVLPEDHLTRGEIFTQTYFPREWFKDTMDDEERFLEQASIVTMRRGRR